MNCLDLQTSLAEAEDSSSVGQNSEQRAHLNTCPECSALVAELNLIASTAIELRSANEPSPRVWNSLEIALREEGLIRPQRGSRSLLPSLGSRWAWARWALPVAAAVLIAVGLYMRQTSLPVQLARNAATVAVPNEMSDAAIAGLNDDDLLREAAKQSPAMQAEYTDNLRHVNQYIQDAKGVVAANPNDDDARRSLMDAYQEKAMLFELAMDRSLP